MTWEEPDYRTPMEKRRDAIKAAHGSDPDRFTPDVLRQIANGAIYDVERHYCPAGKLSMEEARQRELRGILPDEKEPTEQERP